jgi:hypothetical protein
MANTITVVDSSGGKREVSDTPENVQLAKDHGFQIMAPERGVISTIAEGARGLDESIAAHDVTNYNPLLKPEQYLLKGIAHLGGAKTDEDLLKSTKDKNQITVVDSTGGKRAVNNTPENVQLAKDHGFQILGAEETAKAALTEGPRGTTKAYIENVGNEMGFGVPNMAESEEGKKDFAALNAEHPTGALAGTVAGIAANMATPGLNMGGAASKAEKAAALGLKKIGLEASAGLGSKIAVGAAEKAAAGVVYSAPHALGQAFYEDPDKAGESILAGIGIGAFMGGAGPLAGKFISTVKPLAGRALEGAGVTGDARLASMLGAERGSINKVGAEQTKKIMGVLERAGANSPGITQKTLFANVERIEEEAGAKIGRIQEELDSHLASSVKEGAAADKATREAAGYSTELAPGALEEDLSRPIAAKGKPIQPTIRANPIGDGLTNDATNLPPVIGKFGGPGENLDNKVSLFGSGVPDAAAEAPLFQKGFGINPDAGLEATESPLRKAIRIAKNEPAIAPESKVAAMDMGFSPKSIVQKIADEMLPKYQGALFSSERRTVEKAINHIMEMSTGEAFRYTTPEALEAALSEVRPTSFAAGQKLKSQLASGIDLGRGMPPTTKGQITKNVYGLVRDELNQSTERVATALGKPELAAEAQRAREEYWAAKTVQEKFMPNKIAREQGNSGLSLRGSHFIGGGIAHGGLAGAALGAGALIGKNVLESTPVQSTVTAALYGAEKAMRAIAAGHISDNLTRLGDVIQNAGTKGVLSERSKASASPIATLVGSTESDPRKALAALTTKLKPYADDPTKLQQEASGTFHHIADAGDPDAAVSFMANQVKAVNYIYSQMPQQKLNTALFMNREYRPSQAELTKFEQVCAAAQDPFYLVRKIEDGTLTKTHIETVKAIYPHIFEAIQQRIKAMGYERQIKDNQSNLPYDVRMRMQRLSAALGDPSMDPKKAADLQASFKKPQPDSGGGGNAGAAKSFGKYDMAMATPAQRLGLK